MTFDEYPVFRSRLNRGAAIVIWIVAGAMCLATALATNPESWRNLPLAALLAFVAWAALWQPRVVVRDEGVELRNVTHTALVPWDAIIEVDTKFALTLRTPKRAYSAWAAPAPGRFSGRVALRNRRRKAASDDADPFRREAIGERTSDLPHTDSGDAAMLVRASWQQLIAQDRIAIGAAGTTPVVVTLHVATLAAGAVLLAAAALSAFV